MWYTHGQNVRSPERSLAAEAFSEGVWGKPICGMSSGVRVRASTEPGCFNETWLLQRNLAASTPGRERPRKMLHDCITCVVYTTAKRLCCCAGLYWSILIFITHHCGTMIQNNKLELELQEDEALQLYIKSVSFFHFFYNGQANITLRFPDQKLRPLRFRRWSPHLRAASSVLVHTTSRFHSSVYVGSPLEIFYYE